MKVLTDEDPPDPNIEQPPDHNIPDYNQENGKDMSGKRYVWNDKMPLLDRSIALTNITSTNLDDHDIVFPELDEISY
jgi:hypothetical protein